MGENGEDMNRRRYLAGAISTGTLALAGCTGFGNDLYEENAGEYLLSFDEVNRILPGNVSGREVEYEEDEEIDSGRSYRFQDGSLAEFGLMVCKSVDDAETVYDDLVWQVNNTGATEGEQLDLGSEAIFDEASGGRVLGIRLDNVLIQMNGSTSLPDMERLAVAQIDKIQEVG